MLVKVLNFGTSWWARPGRELHDPYRFTRHAAYFNSTGVRCGRKVRRHWIVPGVIRFNGISDFNPHLPNRSLGKTFECTDLEFSFGGHRLLFRHKHSRSGQPDWFLVVLSEERHGRINFAAANWKSSLSQVIAASQLRDMQEAMLLMREGDWVQTNCGFWQLVIADDARFAARLELVEAANLARE
jgi:hypothetical protein